MTIEQRLDRIERLLRDNLKVSTKKTWVKVGHVKQITPWDTRDKLRTARETGLIQCKKTEDGIFYLLESIPEQFIKS